MLSALTSLEEVIVHIAWGLIRVYQVAEVEDISVYDSQDVYPEACRNFCRGLIFKTKTLAEAEDSPKLVFKGLCSLFVSQNNTARRKTTLVALRKLDYRYGKR